MTTAELPDTLPVTWPVSIPQGGSWVQEFAFLDSDGESLLRTGDTFALRIEDALTGELLATLTGANGGLDVDIAAGLVTTSNIPATFDALPTDTICRYDLWRTRLNGASLPYFAGPANIYKRVPTT